MNPNRRRDPSAREESGVGSDGPRELAAGRACSSCKTTVCRWDTKQESHPEALQESVGLRDVGLLCHCPHCPPPKLWFWRSSTGLGNPSVICSAPNLTPALQRRRTSVCHPLSSAGECSADVASAAMMLQLRRLLCGHMASHSLNKKIKLPKTIKQSI